MRVRPVVLTTAAKNDVKAIAKWYRRQRPGLDVQFRAAMRTTIKSIGARPEALQVVHKGARRAAIDGFPHGVFYRVADNEVVVFAVKHPSQHPNTWQSRA